VGENICQKYITERTDNQNIRELKKLNSPKINEPIKKWVTELNRTFSKQEIQLAKKHMQKCSPSVAIKKMQIKTTLKFHLTSLRIAIIKNITNNRYLRGYGEKRTFLHCCGNAS
jgi:CO dehydrogenase/acetyl-CoA synthase beta subunit